MTHSPICRSRSTRYTLEGRSRRWSPEFERLTTTIHLEGGGERGARRGRHLRPGPAARAAGARPGAAAGGRAGRSTRSRDHARAGSTCSAAREPAMPAFRDYRRWAFESAAADLALRQAGPLARRARSAASREPITLRRLAAARRAAERRARRAARRGLPGTALQARLLARLGRRASRRARRDRRGRVDRLQGRLQGHVGRRRRPTRRSTAAAPRGSPRPGWRTPT